MKDFLVGLIAKIIDKPEALAVIMDQDVYTITFTITGDPADYGRIIGKKGKTINALRILLYLYLRQHEASDNRNKKIILRVDSQNSPNGLSRIS